MACQHATTHDSKGLRCMEKGPLRSVMGRYVLLRVPSIVFIAGIRS